MFSVTCRAILFDLDGVLIDSNELYEAHWRQWAQERSVSFAHIQKVHHGRPVPETIRIVAPHLDAVKEAEIYKDGLIHCSHWHHVRPYPGVFAMLKALPPDRWAIVTSAPRTVARKLAAQLTLPVPRVFIAGDDVSRGKPHPDPYLQAAQALDIEIQDCVVIEDAPAGITAANRAGAQVIALTTTNTPETLAAAEYVAPDLSCLTVTSSGEELRLFYAPTRDNAASTASSV